ncbi:MAG: trans-acting enoyl reductase family protein [Pseudohongiellaceae bacterium]
MSLNKEFDLIIFGATSFVGQIVCEYLLEECKESGLTWAMAARSEAKLEELREQLGEDVRDIPYLIANSSDSQSLLALCAKASVIVSTVGPYALYGELLVKACAQTGTDYCDLTGEAPWIKAMLERYESEAKASGARIVNSCGFDSIPSDLGVMFLQAQSQEQFGEMCSSIKMRVKHMKGGASGGTVASGINMFQEAAENDDLQKQMQNPYLLCPQGHDVALKQRQIEVEFDEDFNSWVGPFVMEAINTRIVLRSNAIRQQGSYSDIFSYNEGTLTGSGFGGENKAKAIAFGTKVAPSALSIGVLRNFLTKFVLPKPGQGPSKQEQLDGFYELWFLGVTESGKQLKVKVTGDRDPGYGSTAKMLVQAAISLSKDVDKTHKSGGFWTPATVFDDRIIDRLQDFAGMRFELLSEKH